ncbi:Hpt domain-containing protein [Azospirillum sp.]|uniref:Hpt domain-containing protein n=1 Tax=Azospirillum sp. TaxID=34012 RepID=UPI003D702DA1
MAAATPSDRIASVVIDPEILDVEPMVRNFGGLTALVNDLYALFLRNEEQLRNDLTARLAAGDLQAARLAAHAAGGAARTAGARRLAELCAAIEDALLRGDPASASQQSALLPGAIADVRSMVARI